VGVALGFGAQTLVRDCLSGVFILAEHQIAVGDQVTVAGVTGTVEKVKVRALTLRDQEGPRPLHPERRDPRGDEPVAGRRALPRRRPDPRQRRPGARARRAARLPRARSPPIRRAAAG
jgi:hypothetical protein